MQRAAEAEWQVHDFIIRDEPVPPRLRWLHGRRLRTLDAHRAALRVRSAPPAFPGLRPTLLLRWAPLLLAPLIFVLYHYGSLSLSLYPPSAPVQRPAIPTPLIKKPIEVPPPVSPGKRPVLIPPEIPKLPPFSPDADFSRGPTWERKIALTFDGGAEANATEEILDTLKTKRVRATIFLTGRYIQRYPDLVRRMVQEGHEVGNHTFSHPRLTTYAVNGRQETLSGVTREFLQSELRQAARLFEQVAGRPMIPYWRAPYGEHNQKIRRWAAEIGYLHVGWTRDPGVGEDLDTRDWVADPHSRIYYHAEEVRERILNFGKGRKTEANGGIILLHLGTQRRQDQVHRELPVIIDGLRTRGYRLVPVSDLHHALALAADEQRSAVATQR